MVIFRPSKLWQTKYVEMTWVFRQSKLHRTKHVKTMWIFRSSKLRRTKTVETTLIFRPLQIPWRRYIEATSKKYDKMTCKFVDCFSSTYQRNTDIESTSIWRGFITNKMARSCIFGTRLKHFWMLKTIKSNIYFELYPEFVVREQKKLFSYKFKYETHTEKVVQTQQTTLEFHN